MKSSITVRRALICCLFFAIRAAGQEHADVDPQTLPVRAAVSVSVAPKLVSLGAGSSQQFKATVRGLKNTAVTWSVNGVRGGDDFAGTITLDGLYSAPATVPASVMVTATSVARPAKSGRAQVTFVPLTLPPPVPPPPVPQPPPTVGGGTGILFGMHISEVGWNQSLWPTVPFDALRLYATNTDWSHINRQPGVFDFSVLDKLVGGAHAHGITRLLFTLSSTPQWASSQPNDTTCDWIKWGGAPGGCDPPNDIDHANQHWKDFVTALVAHDKAAGSPIKEFEIWNEPNDHTHWRGTPGQLVRMAHDAYAIIKAADPSWIVTTPGVGWNDTSPGAFFNLYFAAGGGEDADVVDVHSYPGQNSPESLLGQMNGVTAAMKKYGVVKPIWVSEGSWGQNKNLTDSDEQAGFVARQYLLLAGNGVQRFYWYAWDNPTWGTLWSSSMITKAGTAYEEVKNWVGAQPVAPCQVAHSYASTTYTCAVGAQALAVWDSSKSGTQTSPYTAPAAYQNVRDLGGHVTLIPASRVVQVGYKPVLVTP